MSITLAINVHATAPLGTLQRIRDGLNVGVIGPVRQGLGDAVDRYESFVRGRFDRLSKSGGKGQWPPLAASTVRAKLSSGRGVISMSAARGRVESALVGGGKVVQILVETGQLRRSLEITGTGHVRKSIPNGIRTGTTDRTSVYHQHGTNKMPARPIYVYPPKRVADAMAADLAVGVRKLIAQSAAAAAGK